MTLVDKDLFTSPFPSSIPFISLCYSWARTSSASWEGAVGGDTTKTGFLWVLLIKLMESASVLVGREFVS